MGAVYHPPVPFLPVDPDPIWDLVFNSTMFSAYRVVPTGNYQTLGYIAPFNELHVEFARDGVQWGYEFPTMSEITDFLTTSSKGKWFHRVILGPLWGKSIIGFTPGGTGINMPALGIAQHVGWKIK